MACYVEGPLTPKVDKPERVRLLRESGEVRRSRGYPIIGAKHPLLCLMGEEMLEAWGEAVEFVSVQRDPQHIINGLRRVRGWWPKHTEHYTTKLIEERDMFLRDRDHVRIAYDELIESPITTVRKLSDSLRLGATEQQMAAAIAVVKPAMRHSVTEKAK